MFKHPVAVFVSAASVVFFCLTQVANLIAIAHLPTDLREALIAMSHVPTLLAYGILLVGLCLLGYLIFEGLGKRATQKKEATNLTTEFDEHIPDVRVADISSVVALFEGKESDKLLPLLEAEKLTAWARSMGPGEPPLLRISGNIWRSHHLAFFPRTLAQTKNQTFVRKNGRIESLYFDVHLNKAQLKKIWPAISLDEVNAPSIDRIPLTELLKMATDLGWIFVSDNSLHLLDMQDAVRQGGLDGTLTVWGKLKRWSSDELMKNEVLDKIPPEHWKEFFVFLFPALDGDNFHVKSWSPNEKLQHFIDLHVDRVQAATWLRRDAVSYKGTTKPR